MPGRVTPETKKAFSCLKCSLVKVSPIAKVYFLDFFNYNYILLIDQCVFNCLE